MYASADNRSGALLLRSANDRHPRGLANGSDVVGRHYMGHTNSIMFAISRHLNDTVFQKTLALNDFYFCGPDFPYPRTVCHGWPLVYRTYAPRNGTNTGSFGCRPSRFASR